ncbi:DUF6644 family protein [Niveispirillum sp. KHB5.9]|uniref:DUF6644 family protein n=1 Tax=Niveispirillum sp. KHB5.9 TaxID=3400269 RepID=UPI003A862605
MEFAAWLQATPFSLTIRTVPWIIPTLLVVHLLAITLIIGSALVGNLRLAGALAGDVELGTVLRRHLPWLWGAFVLALSSGLALAVSRPDRLIANPAFWAKMLLLCVAVLVTLRLQRNRPAKPLAWASLAIWIAAIICGHGIAYAVPMGAS